MQEFSVSNVPTSIVADVRNAYSIRTTTPAWEGRLQIQNCPKLNKFEWSASQESKKDNRSRYMSFLTEISWPDDYSIVDASTYKLFSRVKLDKYCFNGGIDIILLTKSNIASNNYTNNIRLGIEIKKEVKNKHHSQACIEHLCAASLNQNETVLTLLTDLNDNWVFVYFGLHGRLHKLSTLQHEAKFLLENIFNGDESLDLPEDFVNRCTWNQFVAKSSVLSTMPQQHHDDENENEGGKDTEQNEDHYQNPRKQANYSQKSSSRNRTPTGEEWAGMGGHSTKMLHFGGDVANVLDLVDFIDNEDEKAQIKINYVLQNVVPMLNLPDIVGEIETSSSSTSSQQQCLMKDNSDTCCNLSGNTGASVLSEKNLLYHNNNY